MELVIFSRASRVKVIITEGRGGPHVSCAVSGACACAPPSASASASASRSQCVACAGEDRRLRARLANML